MRLLWGIILFLVATTQLAGQKSHPAREDSLKRIFMVDAGLTFFDDDYFLGSTLGVFFYPEYGLAANAHFSFRLNEKSTLVRVNDRTYNLYRETRFIYAFGVDKYMQLFDNFSAYGGLQLGYSDVVFAGSRSGFSEWLVPMARSGILINLNGNNVKYKSLIRFGYRYIPLAHNKHWLTVSIGLGV
jgi:hypothetical protein